MSGKVILPIKMDEIDREAVKQAAKDKGFSSAAEYIRSLLQSDAGIDFDIGTWGGDRSGTPPRPATRVNQPVDDGR